MPYPRNSLKPFALAVAAAAVCTEAFLLVPSNPLLRRRTPRTLMSEKATTKEASSSSKISKHGHHNTAISSSTFRTALDTLLYPPEQLDARHSESRRDGYWPYINAGKDPPLDYTYGEFDLEFFAALLDRARELRDGGTADSHGPRGWADEVFCDLGSGAGRLVVAAAALHPTMKLCRGIEILPGMHSFAQETVNRHCRYVEEPNKEAKEEEVQPPTSDSSVSRNDDDEDDDDDDDDANEETPLTLQTDNEDSNWIQGFVQSRNDSIISPVDIPSMNDEAAKATFRLPVGNGQYLPMAPVELICGSFTDPYVYFGDANVIFIFSSALNQNIMSELSIAIGRQCFPETIIITTDYPLDLMGTVPPVARDDRLSAESSFRFELVEQVDGYSSRDEEPWIETTAYFHRVVQSMGMSEALERPIPTLEDICFDVAMQRERGELTDPDRFLLGVANNIRFQCLPEAFVPRRYR